MFALRRRENMREGDTPARRDTPVVVLVRTATVPLRLATFTQFGPLMSLRRDVRHPPISDESATIVS